MRNLCFLLLLVGLAAALPLDGLFEKVTRTCDVPSSKALPFCDTSLTHRERAKALASLLTVDEKVSQFSNKAAAVPRLNINAYNYWGEMSHGPAYSPSVNFGGVVKCATSFPQIINLGSTFNAPLWRQIGNVIGTEARCMSNVQQAGLTFWAPNINIFRDPRFGRGQEVAGEDPFHTSTYAENYVAGAQEGEDKSYLRVSACCKHLYAYSLEDWKGVDRHHFDAITTPQDDADTYLPAFESCVRKGKAAQIMCSYNSVNGVPSCANKWLLTDLARGEWGFDGLITSDCGATNDILDTHHYTNSTSATCSASLGAGMDIDCGSFLTGYLKQAIDAKAISETVVDDALVNLFTVRMRLGEFDPVDSQPYLKYGIDRIATKENTELALEAAQESLVLLKNDGTLPLPKKTNVAVFGPSGNATQLLLGNYEGRPCHLNSILQGLEVHAGKVQFEKGCESVACKSDAGFAKAEKLASESEFSLIFVGLDQGQESEGKDRVNLTLPGKQNDLISRVIEATKGKVIIVVLSGGAVDIENLKENSKVNAILWGGYPGQDGARAIADVLFGDVSPSGRLAVTWYSQEFVSQASMFNMSMRSDKNTGYPGRTYRFYTGKPIFSFGEGLSYTSFEYDVQTSSAVLDLKAVEKASSAMYRNVHGHENDSVLAKLTVAVKNTGKMSGKNAILVFAAPPASLDADFGAPIKQLIAFAKVSLQPGESASTTFDLFAHDFTLVDRKGNRVAIPGAWTLQIAEKSVQVIVA